MPNGDTEQGGKNVNLYDEYTYFAGSTQTLADRRQSATQVYIGVNTSIFALIGFLLNDAGLEGSLHLVALPLFVVGILVCIVWDRMINHYKRLINWRYEQLRAMEDKLPGSSRIFNREWDEFFGPIANGPVDNRQRITFSNLERSLPHIILGLYLVYGVTFVIGRIFDF